MGKLTGIILGIVIMAGFASDAQAFGRRRPSVNSAPPVCNSSITFSNGLLGSVVIIAQVVDKENTRQAVINASVSTSNGQNEQTDASGVVAIAALAGNSLSVTATGYKSVSATIPSGKKEAAVYLCKN